MLNTASNAQADSLVEDITFNDNAFIPVDSACPEVYADIDERFHIATVGQLLFLACQLATFLSQHGSRKSDVIWLRKQTVRLQTMMDDLKDEPGHTSEIEVSLSLIL